MQGVFTPCFLFKNFLCPKKTNYSIVSLVRKGGFFVKIKKVT